MFVWFAACFLVIGLAPVLIASLDKLSERGDLGRKLAGWGMLLRLAFEVISRISDDRGWGALPMNFCDWALVAAALSLISGSQFAFELTYFWGFSGTLQALLTPILPSGSGWWRAMLYILDHSAILAASIHALVFRKQRPRLMSVIYAFLAAQFYLLIAVAVNQLGGQNFGYVSGKPFGSSVLNMLPDDYGLYLLGFEGLAVIFFALLYLPWFVMDMLKIGGLAPHRNSR